MPCLYRPLTVVNSMIEYLGSSSEYEIPVNGILLNVELILVSVGMSGKYLSDAMIMTSFPLGMFSFIQSPAAYLVSDNIIWSATIEENNVAATININAPFQIMFFLLS